MKRVLRPYLDHDPKCPEFSQKANRHNKGAVHDSAFACNCGLVRLLSEGATPQPLKGNCDLKELEFGHRRPHEKKDECLNWRGATPAARELKMVSVNEPRFTCPICEASVAESYQSQHMQKHPSQGEARICDHCEATIHKTGVAWVHDLTGTSACALVATPRRVPEQFTYQQWAIQRMRDEPGYMNVSTESERAEAYAAERVRLAVEQCDKVTEVRLNGATERTQIVLKHYHEQFDLRVEAERKLAESEQERNKFKFENRNAEINKSYVARAEAAESLNRELREVLRKAIAIAKTFHGIIPFLGLSEKSYDAFAEAGKELAEIERLLAEGATPHEKEKQ